MREDEEERGRESEERGVSDPVGILGNICTLSCLLNRSVRNW